MSPKGVAMLPSVPVLPPPPNEQEGKCQLGFVLCSSGCRSSHLLEPTQLLIGRLAGLEGVGWAAALLPEMDWQALCLKTPGGGGVERTASTGQGNRGGFLPAWSPSLRGLGREDLGLFHPGRWQAPCPPALPALDRLCSFCEQGNQFLLSLPTAP
jgi:hypothetical protein